MHVCSGLAICNGRFFLLITAVILYSNSRAGVVHLICKVSLHPGYLTDPGRGPWGGLNMFLVNKQLSFDDLTFLLSVKVGLRLVPAGH